MHTDFIDDNAPEIRLTHSYGPPVTGLHYVVRQPGGNLYASGHHYRLYLNLPYKLTLTTPNQEDQEVQVKFVVPHAHIYSHYYRVHITTTHIAATASRNTTTITMGIKFDTPQPANTAGGYLLVELQHQYAPTQYYLSNQLDPLYSLRSRYNHKPLDKLRGDTPIDKAPLLKLNEGRRIENLGISNVSEFIQAFYQQDTRDDTSQLASIFQRCLNREFEEANLEWQPIHNLTLIQKFLNAREASSGIEFVPESPPIFPTHAPAAPITGLRFYIDEFYRKKQRVLNLHYITSHTGKFVISQHAVLSKVKKYQITVEFSPSTDCTKTILSFFASDHVITLTTETDSTLHRIQQDPLRYQVRFYFKPTVPQKLHSGYFVIHLHLSDGSMASFQSQTFHLFNRRLSETKKALEELDPSFYINKLPHVGANLSAALKGERVYRIRDFVEKMRAGTLDIPKIESCVSHFDQEFAQNLYEDTVNYVVNKNYDTDESTDLILTRISPPSNDTKRKLSEEESSVSSGEETETEKPQVHTAKRHCSFWKAPQDEATESPVIGGLCALR